MTEQDRQEFADYLCTCTNDQVYGVFDKEMAARRIEYVVLARAELTRRGLLNNQAPQMKVDVLTEQARRNHVGHLHVCTDGEVFGEYDKAVAAGRVAYAALAWAELVRRDLD